MWSAGFQKFTTETEEEAAKRRENCPKNAELLKSFRENPVETRKQLRKDLGYGKDTPH